MEHLNQARATWLKKIGAALAVFCLALVPRVWNLSAFMTPDGRRWLDRSVDFLIGLMKGDWALTYSAGNPAMILTKWLGLIGILVRYGLHRLGWRAWHDQVLAASTSLEMFLQAIKAQPDNPLDVLPYTRLPIALASALSILAVYYLARRLWGSRVALLAGLLLALEPFYIAHSRLLHTDALTTDFMGLTILTLMVGLETGLPLRWAAISGYMAGLALLCKPTAFFLLPFVCLSGVTEIVYCWRSNGTFKWDRVRPWLSFLALWGAVAGLTYFALWPALWSDPVGTTWQALARSAEKAAAGHDQFFLGRPTSDPGPLFYPVVLLYRSTPLLLLGLALVLWSQPWKGGERRRVWAWLGSYVILFTLFLSLSPKKVSRYLLPTFPVLAVFAGVGLEWFWRQLSRRRAGSWLLMLGVAAIVQGACSLPQHPYYLTYYNPLFGGAWLAPKVLLVGWGEGLDQAGYYLNTMRGVSQLEVASFYRREFDPYFEGEEVKWSDEHVKDHDLFPWHRADYTLLYISQVQRQIPNEATIRYFSSLQPEFVVRLKGINYVWIYRTPERIPDDMIPAQVVQRAQFGEDLRFLGYDVDASQVSADGRVWVNLYWKSLRETEADYRVFLDLVNGVYHVWGKQDGRPCRDGYPTSQWLGGAVVRDRREIEVWPGTPPGSYNLLINVYDSASARWLPPKGGGELVIGPVEIPRRESLPVESLKMQHLLEADLGGQVRLLGYTIQSGFHPGNTIYLTLFWQALAKMDQNYTVFTHLVDGEGRLWGQKDNSPVDGFYPTSQWEEGEIVRDQYDIDISAEALPGEYQLEVGMYRAETGERLAITDGTGQVKDNHVVLGQLQVKGQ
jgi:hypothetical protein